MKAAITFVASMGIAALALPAVAAPDGATLFARCAACHTRTGAGVPGAYPPLGADFRALAGKPAGRRYLALAVLRGLSGPLTVEGKTYRGVMPSQGLDDASAAAVLNHIGTQIAKSGSSFKPFTGKEIAGYRASGATLSSADVARLHDGAGGK